MFYKYSGAKEDPLGANYFLLKYTFRGDVCTGMPKAKKTLQKLLPFYKNGEKARVSNLLYRYHVLLIFNTIPFGKLLK